MNEVKKFGAKLVSHEDLGLWEGDVAPILDETEEVDIHWKGGKLPPRILFECLKWFRMVNEKHSSEAQARLGYNPETGEWRWFAFPQYVVAGLYSKEIPSDELTDEQQAMRLRATKEMAEGGFIEAGTIHSHCDAAAFASGTDDKDEISQNGIHITLGHISDERPEIHGRVVFRKIKYAVHWADWLDGAPSDVPESFTFPAVGASIDEERLMGLCFERPDPVKGHGGHGWASGGWGWDGCDCLPWHYGGRSAGGWDEPGLDVLDTEPPGRSDAHLDELVDGTLEELFYGLDFGDDALLGFIGRFARRLAETECFTPQEILDAVVDGLVEAGDGAAEAATGTTRETATEP